MISLRLRPTITLLLAALTAVFMLSLYAQRTSAQGDQDSLRQEADRLTYEILELKTRRKKAKSDYDALRSELDSLNVEIAAAAEEIQILEGELEECQQAYNESVRDLYKMGDVTELEVFLEAREIEELWEDMSFYQRFIASETQTLVDLKEKITILNIKKRDLRETRSRSARLAETLDIEALDASIARLEDDLSEVNDSLRAMASGTTPLSCPHPVPQPEPHPPDWDVPSPGELLDRVPASPPLSDFKRSGICCFGYTTSYGAAFHGRYTASGVIFNMYDYTCAHRTLPFGTWLLVTFGGNQVIVQVNDRGPFVPGRVLDLSYEAAQHIGLQGVQWTEFEILTPMGG
ncbi:MAG: septal ring lytic transglycosylase RlpA family protein [Actinomycetota bacterium]|nr:septal ring lytic transglycosylase RlpA family protein [Actinomycetota bacterium]